MKTRLKLLVTALLFVVLAGCASQKRSIGASRSDESEVLYRQALKALQDGHFIIRAEEFYFLDGRIKSSPYTYISMRDGWGVAHYSSDLFPEIDLIYLHDTDDKAQITQGKVKKNGDLEFMLEIGSNDYRQSQKVMILLYKNTNKCFVSANLGYAAKFTGYVFPNYE